MRDQCWDGVGSMDCKNFRVLDFPVPTDWFWPLGSIAVVVECKESKWDTEETSCLLVCMDVGDCWEVASVRQYSETEAH